MIKEILKDENIKKVFFAFLVVLLLFFAAKTLNEFRSYKFIGAGLNPVTTISVSGEGEVNAVPDIATLTFMVTEEASTVKDAQDNVSETVNNILSALENEGIEEKDIKTQSYNIHPRYKFVNEAVVCPQGFDCPPPRSGERVLTGYEVSHRIEIKVREIDKAGEVLSLLGSLNVDNLFGPNFSIEDEDELKAEAREIAIDKAKEKAEELASDLGVKITRVVSFNESGGPVFFRSAEEGVGMGAGDTSSSAPLPAGENVITSRVNIVYEIR